MNSNTSKPHATGEKDAAKTYGPGIWFTIHTLAIKAQTDEEKRDFVRYMRTVCENFPCERCRGHCGQHLSTHPIEDYWSVKDINGHDIGMFKWSWVFHNSVNIRTGKKEMDWSTAYGMYSSDAGICTATCGSEPQTPTPTPYPSNKHVKKPVAIQIHRQGRRMK